MANKLSTLDPSLKIRISGCLNPCCQHHLFDVGIVGISKSDRKYYQISIGSDGSNGIWDCVLCKVVPTSKVLGIERWLYKLVKKLKRRSI